nr:hypothetical protein [Bacteroidota bacterium]
MVKKSIYILAAFAAITFNSCKSDFDEPAYSAGTANFTTYVAVGNSLTAGYQDNALSLAGQQNAYPAILSSVFSKVGGATEFNTPYLTGVDASNGVNPAPSGPNFFRTLSKLILKKDVMDCLGNKSLAPSLFAAPIDNNQAFYFTRVDSTGKKHFHNMGVPGAKVRDVINTLYGNALLGGNPFYGRFATNPGTSSMLSDAASANPTFFTLWIGNNDVLGYATAGGTGAIGGLLPSDITPVDSFESAYANIVNVLTSNGAKGACANIPDVASVPFFTTVPYNAITLTSQAQVDGLTAAWAGYNQAATGAGLPLITWKLGPNPMVIKDASFPISGIRQIKPTELVCLTIPQDSLKCANWGTAVPIESFYVLTDAEIANINTYTNQYNTIIKKYADMKGLAYVDMRNYFKTFVDGNIIFNGVTYTTEFVKGGVFSLDGVHPNQRGYALIANEWIRNINSKFGSNLPGVDVNNYAGVLFP